MAEQFAALPQDEQLAVLASLTTAEADALEWDWHFWGRPAQLLPPDDAVPGGWNNWLILAGRGFGKTRSLSESIRELVCGTSPLAAGRYSRIAIIAETAADARDVLVEGQSGLLRVHPKDFRPTYEPSKRRLTWPNGAVATTYNATEPDQLRGPEHDLAACDELAKWDYAREAWDMLQFGLRIGKHPRALITTTPRPIPVLKEIMAMPSTVVTRGSTMDNRSNLAASFLKTVVDRYAGTRLGRQELDAEMLEDVQGALWNKEMFDRNRIRGEWNPATRRIECEDGRKIELLRIVIGVDPSGSSGDEDKADDIGIVAAGKGTDGRGYVLGDWTINASPAGWGKRSVAAYTHYAADRIVAEKNFGGAMVEFVIRTADQNVPVTMVNASRGKIIRAEPISALYEQGRVSHVGVFREMEDQAVQMTGEGYMGDGSPDRVDAQVWALSELMLGDGYDLGRAL